jgi:hypothetical protein
VISNFFPKIVPFIRSCGKWCFSQAGHILQYNMAHKLYVLVDLGYRHIFTVYNIIVFPLQQCLQESATMLRYTYVACFGLKCDIYQPLDYVSRDAGNSCRCIAPYWVFSSNLYTSWNVVVQIFYDKPHDKIWGDIGFFGARKSRGHTQNLSVHSEILNTSA